MVLPDHEIEKRAYDASLVNPFDLAQLNPASYDVRLYGHYKWQRTDNNSGDIYNDTICLEGNHEYGSCFIGSYGMIVEPGGFYLMSTKERFIIPSDLVANVSGKSSLGRVGLTIHSTAGFIDPGFRGQITLEVSNAGSKPIVLYENMKIAQVSFTQLSSPCRTPYGSQGLGSHYQGQEGPQISRYKI